MDVAPKWWDAVDSVLADEKVTPPKSRDTMWGLYNAVTRAEDYRETRKSSPEARLDRVWFGKGGSNVEARGHAVLRGSAQVDCEIASNFPGKSRTPLILF